MLKYTAVLSGLFVLVCVSGCLDAEPSGLPDGKKTYLCAELINEALTGYSAIPGEHLSPGEVVRIETPSTDKVIIAINNYLSRNELLTELKLKIDDAEIESRMLSIQPGGQITAEFEHSFLMTGAHEIKAVAYFEKPGDLPEYEKYMDFSHVESLKEFAVIKPRKAGEVVRIGIFRGAGAENTAKYFNMFENAQADIIDSLSTPVIYEYDCLFIANSGNYVEHEYFGNLQMYAGEGGRGVVIQHAMLGRPGVRNNPFGERTPFMDIVPRMAGRAETFELVIAAKHPAVGGAEPGTVMRQMYYDHIVPELGRDAEVVVENKHGNPVVAVGKYGLGKVIFDGNVNISAGEEPDSGLVGFNAHIARHGVEWFTGVNLIESGKEPPGP